MLRINSTIAPVFHVRALTHIVVGESDAPIPTLVIAKIVHVVFACIGASRFYVIHCAMKKQSADSMNLKRKLDNAELSTNKVIGSAFTHKHTGRTSKLNEFNFNDN